MVYLLKPPGSFLIFKTSDPAIVQELRNHGWKTKHLFWDKEVPEHAAGSCIVEWPDGHVTVEQKVVGGKERAAGLKVKLHEERGIVNPDLQFVGMVRGREMSVSRGLVTGDKEDGPELKVEISSLVALDKYDDDAWELG